MRDPYFNNAAVGAAARPEAVADSDLSTKELELVFRACEAMVSMGYPIGGQRVKRLYRIYRQRGAGGDFAQWLQGVVVAQEAAS